MVKDRPATAGDMPFLQDRISHFRLDDERLEPEQFIVFTDPSTPDEIVAFGRIKPYGDGVFELGSVGVVEARRGEGLGDLVVRRLIERFPVDDVWITTDLTAYFERFGFQRTATCPPALQTKLDRICGKLRIGVAPMHLHRGR
jgi:N-acetylglutamate synthase-like GNAT family acetyltransferase